MSAAAVLDAPVALATDDDVVHLVCECTDDYSLCGLDVSQVAYVGPDAPYPVCRRCIELAHLPCGRCLNWT